MEATVTAIHPSTVDQVDLFATIPSELTTLILGFLDRNKRLEVRIICKNWCLKEADERISCLQKNFFSSLNITGVPSREEIIHAIVSFKGILSETQLSKFSMFHSSPFVAQLEDKAKTNIPRAEKLLEIISIGARVRRLSLGFTLDGTVFQWSKVVSGPKPQDMKTTIDNDGLPFFKKLLEQNQKSLTTVNFSINEQLIYPFCVNNPCSTEILNEILIALKGCPKVRKLDLGKFELDESNRIALVDLLNHSEIDEVHLNEENKAPIELSISRQDAVSFHSNLL